MSKEINRTQVLQNIRVKKMVRNDSWWIKPKDNHASNKEKRNPDPEKKRANVLLATKKFESSPQQANSEQNPASKNAPRKEAKVDTVGETKLQSSTEQLIQSSKTQADKVFDENKKTKPSSAPIDKPNVDNKKKADEFSADKGAGIQPATAVKQKPKAAAPAEPAEATPAKETAAEDKEEHAGAPPEPSNIDNNAFKAPSDAKVGNRVPEATAVGATSGSSVAAEVPAAPKVQLKPPEMVVTQTEPAKGTNLKTENKKASIQTVTSGEGKCHPKETKDDTVVLAVKIKAASVPETADDTKADSDLQVEPLSRSPAQPVIKPPTESSGEKRSPEPDKKVIVEALVDVNARPGEDSPASEDVQPVSDTQSESPAAEAAVKSAEPKLVSAGPLHAQPVSETRTKVVKFAPEQSIEPKQKDAVDQKTALPITKAVAPAPGAETAVKSAEPKFVSAGPPHTKPVSETRTKEVVKFAPEQSIKPKQKDAVDQKTALPITKAVAPTPGAEAAFKPAKLELVSAGPPHTEPVSGARTEEVVKSAPEQSVEPKHKDAVDHKTALPSTKAVAPAPGAETAVKSAEPKFVSAGPPHTKPVSETRTKEVVKFAPEQSIKPKQKDAVDQKTALPITKAVAPTPGAEAAFKPAKLELVSAGPPHTEPVSGARTEEVVKSAPEQSVEPKHKDAVDHKTALPSTKAVAPAPGAEAAVKSAEELIYAGPPHTKQVSGTRNKEVVKSTPEQNVEPKHKEAVDQKTALPITEAEAVQDNSAFKTIKLTDALDVKLQSNKSALKPKISEQTVPEKPKQQNDKTNVANRFQKPENSEQTIPEKPKEQDDNTNTFQKPEEKLNPTQTWNRYGKSSCSFCNRTIDGNIKLILNEPPVILHPECLQCGVCTKALGDLLTLIFVHDKMIHCKDCFQNAANV